MESQQNSNNGQSRMFVYKLTENLWSSKWKQQGIIEMGASEQVDERDNASWI